jgi:hypothetical protein
MDTITGINEFGNLVPVETRFIQKVKIIKGVHEIITKGGRLHYLHSINKPELLNQFTDKKPRIYTAIAEVGNRTERCFARRGYVRVCQAKA